MFIYPMILVFIMFKIFKIILDDFRDAFSDEKNYLFFSPNSSNKPDVISYLEKTKNLQLAGLILRYGEANAVDLPRLLNTYGIRPSQWRRLQKHKSFRIENLEGQSLLLKPPK